MSFGGQSNAPWQRNVMQGHPQANTFHQGTQQMFMQNAQQNNMAAFGGGGMQGGGGTMFASGGGPSVSYPQPRSGLNPVAFQQGGGQSQSHYNSIGTVTKMNNDCGLVNDEVFFYRNVCKGPEPKLGDRVIFEATYSNNGQFKWNATRIQLMQQHQQPQPLMGSSKGNYSSVAPPNEYQRSQMRHNSPKRSPVRGAVGVSRRDRDRRDRERDRSHRSRDKDDDEHDRKRRREDRSRERVSSLNRSTEGRGGAGHAVAVASSRSDRDRERGDSRKKERDNTDRDREERERERERARDKDSHHRAVAKGGRRNRTIRRYMVQIPKCLLTHKYADVQDLRQRYTTLYVPSDFFHANIKWPDTFTPDNPFSLRRPCQFHIMHKVVDPPFETKPEHLEPADANYLYSAKVMLMGLPPIAEIYKKCFESDDEEDLDHHAVHPSRLINFLVGVRGRNEPLAIGGPWSASLDGENPDKDPSVLIRTAIRTCKALTGIDLSNCTQWYRFVELYYHRTEYKNMEKDGPPRVETVVIYLPDIHSCMPSIEEWQTMTQVYKTAADDVIVRRQALVDAAAAAANTNDDNEDDEDKTIDDVNMKNNGDALADEEGGGDDDDNVKDKPAAAVDKDEASTAAETTEKNNVDDGGEDVEMDDSNVSASADVSASVDADGEGVDGGDEQTEDNTTEGADQNVTAQEVGDEKDEPAPEPTHYSELDLKTMKVQEIRDELLARNLSDKGVRNVVMARLAKALNTEKAEETKNKSKPKFPQKPVVVEKKQKNEDEKMDVDQNTSKSDSKKPTTTTDSKKQEKKVDLKTKTTSTAGAKEKSKNISTDKKTVVAAAKAKKNNDELNDLADIIDFELGDIVILDEYDSSKNPEETLPKEMTEKEKAQLIRRYTLPSSPQIVVHPNKNAKGGKFDCAVMSLSVLLDYHPDDTKERFFEVSLFAELFNEMLMRDFAFNIYKEIYLYEEPPTPNNNSTSETTETKADDEGKKEKTEPTEEVKKEAKETKKDVKDKEKSSKDDSKSSNASTDKNSSGDKSTKDQQHNDDSQSSKSESRKRKISTSVSISNGGKERELSAAANDKKMIVAKPQLLLSFVYFDTTQCGYIFEKDLEDLFGVLGLSLSRSQIKKVLGKLATRQAIYYRKLTDKEESLDATPCIEDVDDSLPEEELKMIAAGNNRYETVFGVQNVTNQVAAIGGDDDNKDGLINFNGAIIHVGKLVNQIKRTEKNYSDLEKLYKDLTKQHSDLQKDHTKSSTKIKDLQSELKSTARKLTDTNQDLYSLNRKYRDQHSTLSYIYTRVAPYFVREKDKDKDVKSESSRDKDEKEKDKDKSKDKDSEKDQEKEKVKDEKDKDTSNDDKEKEKHVDDKEKEKHVDDKEKEKHVDDKEKEKPADDKEKEKPKEDKEKDKPKEDKEKPKEDKEKEKPKEVKEKEKPKEVKEKEKPKEVKEKEKPKEEKEKPKEKSSIKGKESATPAKVEVKTVKKSSDLKSTDKTPKKVGTESAKK